MEYKIKNTPLDKMAHAIKVQQGIAIDNKLWNVSSYSRTMAACKTILRSFKASNLAEKYDPYKLSMRAIKDITDAFNKSNLTWTPQAIIKWLPQYEKQLEDKGRFVGLGGSL